MCSYYGHEKIGLPSLLFQMRLVYSAFRAFGYFDIDHLHTLSFISSRNNTSLLLLLYDYPLAHIKKTPALLSHTIRCSYLL